MLQKVSLLLFVLLLQPGGVLSSAPVFTPERGGPWKQALPGWQYNFPADHSVHPDFKTEWWYFTGNLQDHQGHDFGYELTFFRQGVFPAAAQASFSSETVKPNRFVQDDFKFAHFAVSDLRSGKFYFVQKTNRGAFGEAGFTGASIGADANSSPGAGGSLAWMEDWSLTPQADGSWHVKARSVGVVAMAVDLQLLPLKPPVIEGTDGVSQKAAGVGNASHYYSFTRMQTTGTLAVGNDAASSLVRGESWFDHEWASNQLAADQVGWDWFCFQFDDGTELMLYAMRRRDGSVDPVSSGSWVEKDGRTEHLERADFSLQPLRRWKSDQTGASYPLEWRVRLASRQVEFTLKPRLDNQELVFPQISYWEGAIAVEGQRAGHAIKGQGYMELTGYASELMALRGSSPDGGMARTPR